MQEGNKIAIAKVVIRTKQSLACLRPYKEKHLIMETMFFPDEVRKVEDIPVIEDVKFHENEIKMACSTCRLTFNKI